MLYALQVDIPETDSKWEPLWWFGFFTLFTVLNILGVKLSFNFELFFTIVSLLVLIVFYIGAIPKFNFDKVSAVPSVFVFTLFSQTQKSFKIEESATIGSIFWVRIEICF